MVLLNLSVRPLVCGWYAVVRKCLTFKALQREENSSDVKFGPRSVTTVFGGPWYKITRSMRVLAVTKADVVLRGITSNYLVKKFVITNMWLFTNGEWGRMGPMKSRPKISKGRVASSRGFK